MKENVRYQTLLIPRKVRIYVKLAIDTDRISVENVYVGTNGISNTSITLSPLITLELIRDGELDENGVRARAVWNRNDVLPMTKFSLPLFLNELNGMCEDLKTPELYTYTDDRLELNNKIAEKIRKIVKVGQMYTVELSAVVIEQDEKHIEGIKLKINNEQSTVLLTLNEIESLRYNLQNLNVDSVALSLYLQCVNRDRLKSSMILSNIDTDIIPK